MEPLHIPIVIVSRRVKIMGMYTELYLSCSLKPDLPENVKQVIEYLFNDPYFVLAEPEDLPVHEFFRTRNWSAIGTSCSYYFVPFSVSVFKENYLTMRCDLKNYEGEIEKFLDWIDPYLNHFEGDHLGHYRHEENELPTLIFKKGPR